MRLSKSKILSFRQCPKRLWLEVHKPEERRDSPDSVARMRQGDEVGRLARTLYDPGGTGVLLDVADGVGRLVSATQDLLPQRRPIFEAGFAADGVLVLADVLLPVGATSWRAVEVKSATSLKDYHQTDAAVQAFTMRAAGVDLAAISVAVIDSSWVYRGDGRYEGLLAEVDVTKASRDLEVDVRGWVADARSVAAAPSEPDIRTGPQCEDPFPCPFEAYCRAQEPTARHPAAWLPRIQKRELKEAIQSGRWREMADVPDELLTAPQKRVKAATITGTVDFNRDGAARALAAHKGPWGFLDFEAVQLAIPRWTGTRPYQQLPFQFSFHHLAEDGTLTHREFLDLTGDDPTESFATSLIAACDTPVIFAYNASFEKQRIGELKERYPRLAGDLDAIERRIVDLLPIVSANYYHPAQKGSWSLKAVLPTIAPDLDYSELEEVQDGGQAVEAYLAAIDPKTDAARREEIRQRLLAYCQRDTYALVVVWWFFTGRPR